MPPEHDTPPVRLVAVAADPGRAQALADQLAGELHDDPAPPVLVASVAEALSVLRRQPVDAVVALHQPPAVDALVLARALRGAGDETPVAVLGHDRSIDLESAAWDAGADEYACLAETTAAQLAGRLRRAIDARERLREARRLLVADQQRLAREQEEAQRLVAEQHRLIAELGGMPEREAPATVPFAPSAGGAEAGYADLVAGLATGVTPQGVTVGRLADDLAASGVTGPRLLELHLASVSEATGALSAKAARVVRGQADRLLLEAVVHLAEAYRRRYVAGSQATPLSPAARAA